MGSSASRTVCSGLVGGRANDNHADSPTPTAPFGALAHQALDGRAIDNEYDDFELPTWHVALSMVHFEEGMGHRGWSTDFHECQYSMGGCSASWSLVDGDISSVPQTWTAKGTVTHPGKAGDTFKCGMCSAKWACLGFEKKVKWVRKEK